MNSGKDNDKGWDVTVNWCGATIAQDMDTSVATAPTLGKMDRWVMETSRLSSTRTLGNSRCSKMLGQHL